MKNKKNYLVVKNTLTEKTLRLEYLEIDGFNLTKERKKTIKGVSIDKIIIVNKDFIEKAINKKINKKIKFLLELLASICENDDDSGSAMNSSLNEVEKFKRIIQNEYISYMNKKQLDMLNKKLKLIEDELKVRLYQYNKYNMINNIQNSSKEEEIEKSSHRRR